MIVIDTLIGLIVYDVILAFIIFVLLLCLTALIKSLAASIKMKHPPEGLDELEVIKWKIACLDEERKTFPMDIFYAIAKFFSKDK